MTREEAKPFYIRVQGNRNYFSAAGRISWFRQAHPDYTILTTPHTLDFEKMQAVFVATIMDPSGRVLSMGHKSCSAKQFAEWITKAETGAVNRALILLGFGEPDEDELDESDTQPNVGARVVDAPQETRREPQTPARPRQQTAPPTSAEAVCVTCNTPVSPGRAAWCKNHNLPPLCAPKTGQPNCEHAFKASQRHGQPGEQPALAQ